MLSDLEFDFYQAPAVTLESLQDGSVSAGGCYALLEEKRQMEALLHPLAEAMGPRLLLPEVWQEIFPQCGVLISSAISGGTFQQRLQDAPSRRSWLLLEPVSMVFPLPCPSGQGQAAPIPQDGSSFYSASLCCQYTHFLRNDQGFLHLWDTDETLTEKLRLAQEAGFCGYVLP